MGEASGERPARAALAAKARVLKSATIALSLASFAGLAGLTATRPKTSTIAAIGAPLQPANDDAFFSGRSGGDDDPSSGNAGSRVGGTTSRPPVAQSHAS